MESHLSEMETLLHTHGEQIQYWDLQAKFSLGSRPQQMVRYLRMVILLCESYDWSSFWLRLDNPIVKVRRQRYLHLIFIFFRTARTSRWVHSAEPVA